MAIVDSYSESNRDSGLNLNSGGTTRCGQSFTPSFSGKITSCQFFLQKGGSPTGNVIAYLYLMSGNLGGNNDVPINFALSTSNPVNISTVTGSYSLITFNFVDHNLYNLVKGINYVIAVEYTGGDGSNFLTVGYDASSPSHVGNQTRFSGSWSANVGDTCFYVNAEEVSKSSSGFRGLIRPPKVGNGMGSSIR